MNGITEDGRYIHIQSVEKVTEYACASYAMSYIKKNYNTSIKTLLVQDAGGSTGVYSTASKILTAGEKEGINGRSVVTVVCAKRKNTIEKVNRTLTLNTKGSDVLLLQQLITGVAIDGIYGLGTKAQIKEVQKNLNLYVDGICGNNTLKALNLK